jgi:hypothetical protein
MIRLLLLATVLVLSGCISSPGTISAVQEECCGDVPINTYQNFLIDAQHIPAFLGPIIVSNFSVAMAQKGYQPESAAPSDLTIVLRFSKEHDAIMIEEQSKDTFSESIGPGANVSFMATISIEIFDNSTNLIWKGRVERFHDVGHGEYMHTGNASIAFYDAFLRALESFPDNDNFIPAQ